MLCLTSTGSTGGPVMPVIWMVPAGFGWSQQGLGDPAGFDVPPRRVLLYCRPDELLTVKIPTAKRFLECTQLGKEEKEELCWISSRARQQSLPLSVQHIPRTQPPAKQGRQGGTLTATSGRKKLRRIKEDTFINLSREKKVMAVTVSSDLTVQLQEDVNTVKLIDRQQALRAAIQRGESKCLGVSQVMLGLMVMSYSIPLHFTEVTEVVSLGVPWWSGLTFIAAGVVAIILDKHCTMKILQVCLMVSVVSTVLSLVAVIIYSVDIDKNPVEPCVKTPHGECNAIHYATKLSRGVKSALLLFTLAQAAVSGILCFLLLRQRRSFGQYTSLIQDAPSTPAAVAPPDLN